MSPIEARIKAKIEEIGVPLKEWDVRINYGIKTGFNEAFIIDEKTKDNLINKSPKSAEIIRPILRGRDIKKYKAEFAGYWLINAHNGIKSKNIKRIYVERDYPIIYEHLLKYKPQLVERLDKGEHWTNLRNCAYLEDLESEKLIWIELTDRPNFYFDIDGYYTNNTVFFMVGKHLPYILAFLNSMLCEWYFTKIAATSGAGTRRWIKMYIDQIRIPLGITEDVKDKLSKLALEIQELKKLKIETLELEDEINEIILNLFGLTHGEKEIIFKG
jgi:adenine-specific DNA-methyltransferase